MSLDFGGKKAKADAKKELAKAAKKLVKDDAEDKKEPIVKDEAEDKKELVAPTENPFIVQAVGQQYLTDPEVNRIKRGIESLRNDTEKIALLNNWNSDKLAKLKEGYRTDEEMELGKLYFRAVVKKYNA